jgi:hypothetical protein
VVGERVAVPELERRLEDLGDPVERPQPDVADVVDDVRSEQLIEAVELSVVEQVAM